MTEGDQQRFKERLGPINQVYNSMVLRFYTTTSLVRMSKTMGILFNITMALCFLNRRGFQNGGLEEQCDRLQRKSGGSSALLPSWSHSPTAHIVHMDVLVEQEDAPEGKV